MSYSYSAAVFPVPHSGETATSRTMQLECGFVSQPSQHATTMVTQAKQTESDRCTFQDGVGGTEHVGRGVVRCRAMYSIGCPKITGCAIEICYRDALEGYERCRAAMQGRKCSKLMRTAIAQLLCEAQASTNLLRRS